VPALRAPGTAGASDTVPSVRAIFVTYLFVIVAGLTFFTIVGLTHH
jgi:hypothetical protein